MEEQKISFISEFPHLLDIEECAPKSMVKSIPDWWKNQPTPQINFHKEEINFGTVKNCPSFPDYFSQGYVIRMWVDTVIDFNKSTGEWFWKTAHKDFKVEFHDSAQFVNFAAPIVNNNPGYAVFKLISPWSIITPDGYSVLQLPMFYNFNEDFTILPGVIASDVEHSLNLQILIHSNKSQIVIERGTPLAQYIPFKRSNTLPMEYREATEEDTNKLTASNLHYETKFYKGKEYLKRKRETDKKIAELEK